MFTYLCVSRHFRHYTCDTFKSYYFLFFRRFVRTRSGAPAFSMWKLLDLKIQEMTTIFIKLCI